MNTEINKAIILLYPSFHNETKKLQETLEILAAENDLEVIKIIDIQNNQDPQKFEDLIKTVKTQNKIVSVTIKDHSYLSPDNIMISSVLATLEMMNLIKICTYEEYSKPGILKLTNIAPGKINFFQITHWNFCQTIALARLTQTETDTNHANVEHLVSSKLKEKRIRLGLAKPE